MSRVAVETIPVLTQASFAVVKTISPSALQQNQSRPNKR